MVGTLSAFALWATADKPLCQPAMQRYKIFRFARLRIKAPMPNVHGS
jgi:hypothetical protein